MYYRKLAVWLCLNLCLVSGFFQPAFADKYDVRELESSGHIMRLGEVIERVNLSYPGRILEVELHREEVGYVYEIEIIDKKGIIWELEIDATTGELLKKEKE